MTIWYPNLADPTGPLYLAIAEAISGAVAAGTLAPGDRLPPQRELAHRLGVSLNTVTRGYAEAIRRGLLEGTVGRGTHVRHSGPEAAAAGTSGLSFPLTAALARPAPDSGVIDLANNLPTPADAEVALARTLEDLSHSTELRTFLDHKPDAVTERHTSAAFRSIGSLGLGREGRCLVLTNGAQQGIFVTLMALTRPGDAILVEELTYAPVLSIARHLGLTALPVAMDDEGVHPDALDALCQSTAARVLYCIPTLHTPTTATMSPARREAIATLARKHQVHVIEDDVFGFLPRTRPAPLATHIPDLTVFVTSTSKSLAPGLRVGYVHAPQKLRSVLQSGVAATSWMPPPLMAEIATRWIEDGTAIRLNSRQQSEAEDRQSLARAVLAGQRLRAQPTGFHVWLSLPEYWNADAFEAAARRDGVAVRSAADFAVHRQSAPSAIRLCLSHEASRDRLALGLQRVARLLEGRPEGAFLV